MRLTLLTLTGLSAVLDYIAGSWKGVITVKAGDQEHAQTVYVTGEWSSDKQSCVKKKAGSSLALSLDNPKRIVPSVTTLR